jgi:hypothetical protein
MGYKVEVTFKVQLEVDTRTDKGAEIEAGIWAQRFTDVGVFEDASETTPTCTPAIRCTGAEVDEIEVVRPAIHDVRKMQDGDEGTLMPGDKIIDSDGNTIDVGETDG